MKTPLPLFPNEAGIEETCAPLLTCDGVGQVYNGGDAETVAEIERVPLITDALIVTLGLWLDWGGTLWGGTLK